LKFLKFLKLKQKKILLFFDQGIVSGSNFMIGIFLARNLSIDVFGKYSLLWLVMLYVLSFQQSFIIAPMYSLEPKKNKSNLPTVVLMQLLYSFIAVIVVVLFFLLAAFFDDKWNIGFLLIPFSLSAFFYLLQDFSRRYFFLKEDYKLVVIIDIVAYLGFLLLLFLFSKFRNLNLSIIYCLMIAAFLISFLVAFMKMDYLNIKIRNLKVTIKEYWGYSKWLSFSAFIQGLGGNLFVILGSAILGTWIAGVIRIFQNLMGVFNVFFNALENFIPISAAKIYNIKGYKYLLNYIFRFSYKGLLLFILFWLSVYLVSPDVLIRFIYGDKYIEFSYLFHLYVGLYLLLYFSLLLRFIFRTVEDTKTIFFTYIISLIFSFLIAFPLIYHYEIKGIVIGMVLTNIVMVCSYIYKINIIGKKLLNI
jgi:O-antigen/teichoic acid export membrane protein